MTSPLDGKTVAIVHPAWHSCGTYQVVLGQADAYRSLGARVLTVACSDIPGMAPSRGWAWASYRAHTPELDAQDRFFAGLALHAVVSPHFLAGAVWPFLHGDQAAMRVGAAQASTISAEARETQADLVHCNHFFCMPVARRLARGAPLLLDTHDLQAAQFDLTNKARTLLLPPRASYDAMLERELREMRQADALIHLNADEDRFFRAALPAQKHHLLYPALRDVPTGPGGPDILIVSSRNAGNVESLLWFLREVLPAAGDPPVKIVGSVDAGVRAADPALYERYRSFFAGRVDDPAEYYGTSRLVLLPTVAGTGLSIKTVEALASGLPVIATPHAFRGAEFGPASLGNVTTCETAEAFASALRRAAETPQIPGMAVREASESRAAYTKLFSPQAYRAGLMSVVDSVLG